MNLKECYDALGGGYESVKQRIPSDEMLKKFLLKFLHEPSYENLCQTLKDEDYEEAFRAAHSLKGVSANLGFQALEKSSSVLTELLRNSQEKQIDQTVAQQMLGAVSKDYNEVMETVRILAEL